MDYFKSLVGGKPSQVPVVVEDSDFADFADAPAPSPVSIPASPADAQAATPTDGSGTTVGAGHRGVYTKWYRVWERTQPSDFIMEGVLIPFIIVALLVHFWGTRTNRRKARKWVAVHAPLLEREFALVGYSQVPKITPYPAVQGDSLLEASAKLTDDNVPEDLYKEKTAWEFETYASGRLNAAFVDVRLYLRRRMNPLYLAAEEITGMFFESVKPKAERVEAVLYTFDGKEKDFVPPPVPGSEEAGKVKPVGNSTYDGFVFAIVNKMVMRRLRDERYDLSLTFTKDNAKLPNWVTVMSESAEVTETMLTKDLIAAVEKAGDLFEYLIVTDQPTDKPTNLNETTPKKRLHLSLRLPKDGNYLPTLPIFEAFLRLPDFLVAQAHFRPEVMKKVNAIREAEKAKLKKLSDKEAEEERLRMLEKMKKEERDRKMKGMSAEEQRKFLERENEKQRKKQEKKMTRRG
ncbi:hypothetical protein HRR83_009432 [Exophiala dermatitidis]|uniref:Uncharacterized protein n=1 Tax=Exophiala dermatitidis TaxID=5970 RepID=A0AAN6EJJ3_EXODE|nr:hypothetical protein HRR75_008760 [Exophiala dermatitidis]KAJ4502267.1 hypothetical protein HRR73_009519 [Exophiala dermatitidis]KAJ4534262.1 hypothetical protein HRR76_006192 [Exophiala dermatitidis]KAJ4535632.1 hypothetical protein HRR78_008797 [Exophiala dermatitidis]KAJ4553261.1 hypothetical protein HRR79_009718 [Exophiala dermatitidis]